MIHELHHGILHCLSAGYAQWSFNGTTLPSNVQLLGRFNVTLKVIRARLYNHGYYDCQGFTQDGWIFYSRSHITVVGNTVT